MERKTKVIRLVYPQWQGANIADQVPEIEHPKDASQGYWLGALMLDFLAPATDMETLTVPVSMEYGKRKVQDGVMDRDILVQQSRTALEMLRSARPDKIVTLGGECSVSVVPFTYLADKYEGNVTVVWIDAHPDITLPGDVYTGYHAMAAAAVMGKGDREMLSVLPAAVDPSNFLYVGVRNWEREEIKVRQKEYGIAQVLKRELTEDSSAVLRWLERHGDSKVLIHLDLDVLDPAEIIAAVGRDPNGMTIEQVVGLINDIARAKDVVGLTVAEPMPRTAIRLKKMLEQLPLLK